MPPKVRITKEEIIKTAVEVVRCDGAETLNARVIAKELGCSTQPVFSNFASMEDLKHAVVDAADDLYQQYIKREIELGKYPEYKASGMAYIRFAKEERELFKLLFMRDRSDETVPNETGELQEIYGIAQTSTGIDEEKIKLFHLEMWAYVHGIAAMTATNYLQLDTDLVSEMLTDAYQGLKNRYKTEEA